MTPFPKNLSILPTLEEVSSYQTMALVTIIWNPARSRVIDPSLPEFNCPVRFPIIQAPNPKGVKGGAVELEVLATDALIPGTNFVKEEIWEAMKDNPFMSKFMEAGAIHVILPAKQEGFEATGTTLDYSETDAKEIISQSLDIEWLKNCISAEAANASKTPGRNSDKLIDACQKQIKLIESSAKKMAAAAAAKGTGED